MSSHTDEPHVSSGAARAMTNTSGPLVGGELGAESVDVMDGHEAGEE